MLLQDRKRYLEAGYFVYSQPLVLSKPWADKWKITFAKETCYQISLPSSSFLK